MTPSEIDAMPAGPEMDALIAEKVFGFIGQRYEYPGQFFFYIMRDGEELSCPPYSTSDEAALGVFKRLAETKAAAAIERIQPIIGPTWWCGWEHGLEGAEGETLALAVCRAALHSVEDSYA